MIQLKASCILNVPLQTYGDDFTFVVNENEIKTSRLVSDLLSPKICRIHLVDPTFDKFIIKTKHFGSFSKVLDLLKFTENEVANDDINFLTEVIEILENDSIEITNIKYEELTIDNIFSEILLHEKCSKFYSKRLSDEIELISSHFNEICDTKRENFTKIRIETLIKIVTSPNLRLNSEDQLLSFVNWLYTQNRFTYSILYEFVNFLNVTSEIMSEFIEIYDFNDLTSMTWNKLSIRLKEKIINLNEIKKK